MPKVNFDSEKCKGCGLCASVCPKKIIGLTGETNSKGFKTPEINEHDKCIGCASCAVICPDCAVEVEE